MAEMSGNSRGGGAVVVDVEEEGVRNDSNAPLPLKKQDSLLCFSVPSLQKIMAELVGTYFMMFAGSAAVIVNAKHDNVVTFPGIAIVWGLVVMVIVYTIGHISGAHLNPSVTIAFATSKRFPFKLVPAYVFAQLIGTTLAAVTLRLIFSLDNDVCSGKNSVFIGSVPTGSNLQAFVMEFVISFFLMFVVSGVATDNRAIGELAGLVVGATVLLNTLFAGLVSGSSTNPAKSLGPAIVFNCYKGVWIYLTSPILGTIFGAWTYNIVRYTDKSPQDITESASFFKSPNVNSH